MKGSFMLYNLKLNCLIFSTSLNSSLIIFIRTYSVNYYRSALDRLRVRMNIILFVPECRSNFKNFLFWLIPVGPAYIPVPCDGGFSNTLMGLSLPDADKLARDRCSWRSLLSRRNYRVEAAGERWFVFVAKALSQVSHYYRHFNSTFTIYHL